ncbi:GGDEF domain-containing protein [Pseudobutyrivibrio ruminis]|uniref:GGDEF domain-containing protein n=1 Tax=Pseudobutyrivibrio ruminis TaxID=46206 RepID=UPI00051C8E42|nr:diguanylate cyclase [Pseudobutyrivibrio ruminis]
MGNNLYSLLKQTANLSSLPCTIMSVEKKSDGTCGDIRFYAINDIFKRSYYDMFIEQEGNNKVTFEDFDEVIEGQLYTAHLPKEPKFEDICFRAAWGKEHIHTYVDTTKMYGYWTEDILLPVNCEHDETIAYCQFMYTLNKEMDTGKFSAVSPDISSFVIKVCLEMRNENAFSNSMDIITRDLREYANSESACILTVDSDQKKFEIISESVRNNAYCIKDIFSNFSFEIVGCWEKLLSETNNIIIQNNKDMSYYESQAPDWIKTYKDAGGKALCLMPFIHHGVIIGYLYISNFDTNETTRLKDTLELISFFLTAEVANHMILEKLEYLSNVDILTGVLNRNCMNVNVDELSLKLKLDPKPFAVAFCDLNGLKTINDHGGHNSGDELLKDAAKVLKEVFIGDQIYRAGGDEFAIISLNSTEEEFLEKLALLRQKACDPDWLNFAIGHYYDANSGNLRLAMRYADENMYEDKNAFYEAYPDKRR